MKKIWMLLLLINNSSPAQAASLDAADFGFDAQSNDNYPALRLLEAWVGSNRTVSVTFTNGTYTNQFPVSGNPTYRGSQRGACEFTGATNITLYGPEAELYSTNRANSEQSFFRFKSCTNTSVTLKFKGLNPAAGAGLKALHFVSTNDTATVRVMTHQMFDGIRVGDYENGGTPTYNGNINFNSSLTNVDSYYGSVFFLTRNVVLTNQSIGTASNAFLAHRSIYINGCSNVLGYGYSKDLNVPDGVNVVGSAPSGLSPYHLGSTNVSLHVVDLGTTNYVQFQSVAKIYIVASTHQNTNIVHDRIWFDVTAPSTSTIRTNNYALAIGGLGVNGHTYTNITFSGTFQHGASNAQNTIYFESTQTGLGSLYLNLSNFYDTVVSGLYTLVVSDTNPIVVVTATNSTVNAFYFAAPANPQTFTDNGDFEGAWNVTTMNPTTINVGQ